MEKIVVHVDADIGELIPGFLENRHRDVKTIISALEYGDYETILLLGHSMRGSGRGYGFNEITSIGKSIETAAKEKNSEDIKRWLGDLSNYLERVEVVYE
ncbi:MAG: Hpt domain-containing protein [Nitrospinae bacterium]|nr:Hpt domain-containing protein [Nitrospinota bacterium]